jgi:hypothetical protein
VPGDGAQVFLLLHQDLSVHEQSSPHKTLLLYILNSLDLLFFSILTWKPRFALSDFSKKAFVRSGLVQGVGFRIKSRSKITPSESSEPTLLNQRNLALCALCNKKSVPCLPVPTYQRREKKLWKIKP